MDAIKKPKFSTSTITSRTRTVPWLAAEGPLSYTPENPPHKDYFFQYGWILPQLINAKVRQTRHYYFGASRKEDAEDAFRFWNGARDGRVSRIILKQGTITPLEVTAPIAIYRCSIGYREKEGVVLIQHGSYQFVEREEQPTIEQGFVTLYRGIQTARKFYYLKFGLRELTAILQK